MEKPLAGLASPPPPFDSWTIGKPFGIQQNMDICDQGNGGGTAVWASDHCLEFETGELRIGNCIG